MVYGLLFSVIGYVFTEILLDDLLYFYDRWLDKLPEWLQKPLGRCSVCFTGQLSLWGMMPFLRFNYESIIMYFGIISINMIIVKILKHGN